MNKMRPVHIFWQKGVKRKHIVFSIKIIRKILKLAGVDKKIKVKMAGNVPNYFLVTQYLAPKSKYHKHFDCGKMMDFICLQQKMMNYNNYHSVFFLKDEIFLIVRRKRISIAGLAVENVGIIVELGDDSLMNQCRLDKKLVGSVIIHEIGHLFGLPSIERTKKIKLCSVNRTRHCANNCIMHPDSEKFSNYSRFCRICKNELREYFNEK